MGLEVLPCDAIADGVRVDEAVFEDEGFEVAVEVCHDACFVCVYFFEFEPFGEVDELSPI